MPKDLSAYSLTHDITDRKEVVELPAWPKFFDSTSESRFQKNREWLILLGQRDNRLSTQAESIIRETIEQGQHTLIRERFLDQLFPNQHRLRIIPPVQGVFAESVAPFDRKPLTESVDLQTKRAYWHSVR